MIEIQSKHFHKGMYLPRKQKVTMNYTKSIIILRFFIRFGKFIPKVFAFLREIARICFDCV